MPEAKTVPRRPLGLRRRHVLMLALAAEVLMLGVQGAQRRRAAGITVDVPSAHGHVIT